MKNWIAIVLATVAIGLAGFSLLKPAESVEKEVGGLKNLAFVYSDTINNGYRFIQDKTELLEKDAEAVRKEFESRISRIEQRFLEFQSRVSSMNQREIENAQVELAQMEEKANVYRGSESRRLDSLRGALQEEFFQRVNTYLKEYNKEKQYQAIFSYTLGGQLLLMDEASDVTFEVLNGLNEEYQNEIGE